MSLLKKESSLFIGNKHNGIIFAEEKITAVSFSVLL